MCRPTLRWSQKLGIPIEIASIRYDAGGNRFTVLHENAKSLTVRGAQQNSEPASCMSPSNFSFSGGAIGSDSAVRDCIDRLNTGICSIEHHTHITPQFLSIRF